MTLKKTVTLGARGPEDLVFFDIDCWGVPDLRSALSNARGKPLVDILAFTAWLRTELIEYDLRTKPLKTRGQRAAEAQWLECTAEDMTAAIADGRLKRMPQWRAEPQTWVAARRLTGLMWLPR